MKKLTIVLAIIIVILSLNKQEKVVMPKETIRFRVIANSNNEEDQNLKKQIVKNLESTISSIEYTPKDIETTRNNIKKELPKFSAIIEKTLKDQQVADKYTINYGMNYFPRKEYQGVVFEEGEYESLVVTLGDGLGENFWCILFPPLCLLEQEETDQTEIEYTSFIQEVIDKYF